MAEYVEREALKGIFNAKADMAAGTPKEVFYAAVKMIETLPAADVVDAETYNDLRETFVEFVCSGVHNPAPYCKNRRSTCVDSRGWCTYNGWCEGFNPDGRKG